MSDDVAEGYEVPLHTSITQPILLGGVDRNIALMIWTPVAAFSLPLGYFYIAIPIGLILHAIIAWFTSKEPHFYVIMRRHLKQKSFLD